MKLARITAWFLALSFLLGAATLLCAEEITLKDGQKIVGTIVGYEKDMFRVETDYGIALIRKDKVVSIEVSMPQTTSPSAPPIAAKKPVDLKPTQPTARPAIAATTTEPPHISPPQTSTPSKQPIPATPAAATFPGPRVTPPQASDARPVTPPPTGNLPSRAPGVSSAPPSAPRMTPAATIQAPTLPQVAPPPTATTKPQESTTVAVKPSAPPATAKPLALIPVVAKPAPPPPPPVSHPIDVPPPAHLEEHVDGNTYFSDTFHFSMFKPPDWKIFEGVTKETGTGIMAMGTDDEQTVLIVDRQVWSGTPKLSSDDVEAKFRQTYQDYRLVSREPAECAGQPAIRSRFTGSLDGVEWHGVTVHLIRGNVVFGITGVTSAETFGFQEAIFNKIVNSVSFLTPPDSADAAPKP